MASYTTLTYSPYNYYNAVGPYGQTGYNSLMNHAHYNYNSISLGHYPFTLTQNNVLDTSSLDRLRIDTSRLNFIEDFPEPFSSFDNSEHDTYNGTNFHFHRSDDRSANSLYYSGFVEDYPGSSLFLNFGNSLFTDPYNYHYTLPNGQTGYNDYLVKFPEIQGFTRPLIDPDTSNPARFHLTYGLDQDGNPIGGPRTGPFNSSEYNDHQGSHYGEFMHWMEALSDFSSYMPTPNYLPYSPLMVPQVNIFEQSWSGLNDSDAWNLYIEDHVIGNHGGNHNLFDVINSVFD